MARKHLSETERRVMERLRVFGLFVALALPNCTADPVDTPVASEATSRAYVQERSSKGVVVLSVNWGRKWHCGGFENAELKEIFFDRLPTAKKGDEIGDLVLKGPSGLYSKWEFIDYVFLAEPGEYALSYCSIRAVRSASEAGYLRRSRNDLIPSGRVRGGSFAVKAGEAVYIGQFSLPDTGEPRLWRYYPEGRKAFRDVITRVGRKYSFLDVDSVQFRLFQADMFGQPYELPSKE